MKKDKQIISPSGKEAVMFLAFGIISFSFRNTGIFSSLVSGLLILYISLKLYAEHKRRLFLFILVFSILVILSVVPFLTRIVNVLFILTGLFCLVLSLVRAIQYFLGSNDTDGQGE